MPMTTKKILLGLNLILLTICIILLVVVLVKEGKAGERKAEGVPEKPNLLGGGLKQYAANCYLNTALQILNELPELKKYCHEKTKKERVNNLVQFCLDDTKGRGIKVCVVLDTIFKKMAENKNDLGIEESLLCLVLGTNTVVFEEERDSTNVIEWVFKRILQQINADLFVEEDKMLNNHKINPILVVTDPEKEFMCAFLNIFKYEKVKIEEGEAEEKEKYDTFFSTSFLFVGSNHVVSIIKDKVIQKSFLDILRNGKNEKLIIHNKPTYLMIKQDMENISYINPIEISALPNEIVFEDTKYKLISISCPASASFKGNHYYCMKKVGGRWVKYDGTHIVYSDEIEIRFDLLVYRQDS